MENVQSSQPVQKPDNYLAWAILSTILCCLPFGVVSIVYSSKVDSLWGAGDHAGARDASKKAKNWMVAAVATAVGFWVLYIAVIAIGTLTAISLSY